jgi:hypothetical protein
MLDSVLPEYLRDLRLALHPTAEKGSEDCASGGNMPANGGEIEVNWSVQGRSTHMGGTDKQPEKVKTTRDGGKKPPPKAVEDEDEEDGDFATPKRDRHGDDDQPI